MVAALLSSSTPRAQETPVCGYRVIASYPHDPTAFTQGLAFAADGTLYEGTGLRGDSSIREVDLASGSVVQIYELPEEYFGEGITVWGDDLIQLTYTSEVGFVYNRVSFALVDHFAYDGQGWGLTHDGRRLIMSNGSSELIFLDPGTYAEIGRVTVRDHLGPVVRLNELEVFDGLVHANVWYTERIARIDPATGRVVAWIDLSGLLGSGRKQDVLNGIAYDGASGRLIVTGKLWPTVFEIELVGCPVFWDGFESGDLSAWPRPPVVVDPWPYGADAATLGADPTVPRP